MSARWLRFCCRFAVGGAARRGATPQRHYIDKCHDGGRQRETLPSLVVHLVLVARIREKNGKEEQEERGSRDAFPDYGVPITRITAMSTKRKNANKAKSRPKLRKVEYDEEDISSEHDSEVDDAEAGSNADGDDTAAEDALADVSNMPELPAPEVIPSFPSPSLSLSLSRPPSDVKRRDADCRSIVPIEYIVRISKCEYLDELAPISMNCSNCRDWRFSTRL